MAKPQQLFLVALAGCLVAIARGRLGASDADAGGAAGRGEERRLAEAEGASSSNAFARAGAAVARSYGFSYYASTTIYGDTPMTACGELDTKELVKGTPYYAVATAQSMQADYPDLNGGGCSWECKDGNGAPIERCNWEHAKGTLSGSHPAKGCSCKQVGSCMCGKAGPGTGAATGTAPMGCFTCGRGQFVKRHPYDLDSASGNELMGEEVKVVVADACPYGPNDKWCPAKPGETNAAGAVNHLDFATPPQFGVNEYANNFFIFSLEPCPAILLHRMKNKSTCPAAASL